MGPDNSHDDEDLFESLSLRDWELDDLPPDFNPMQENLQEDADTKNPDLWYPQAVTAHRMPPTGRYSAGWPQGAVVHFTAGRCDLGDKHAEGTIKFGATKKHCYFCISTTGRIYQTAPLSHWGHHCGKSKWPALGSSLSSKLVGIEICNAGRLEKRGPLGYEPYWNKPGQRNNTYYGEGDVRQVTAGENILDPGVYHRYTPAQEQSLIELILWLHKKRPDVFKIDYVLGHDEISPNRKNDPGGSLSVTMPAFRAMLREHAQAATVAASLAPEMPVVVAGPESAGATTGPTLFERSSNEPRPPEFGPRFHDLLAVYRALPTEFEHLKDITFAQWAHESGYGRSELSVRHNNYAGMKWRPDMRAYATQVYYKPDHDPMDTAYCGFATLQDFVRGYWHRLDIPSLPYATQNGGWRAHSGAASEFIAFIGSIWAPEGGGNSPLNNGYVRKVKDVYERLSRIGLLPSSVASVGITGAARKDGTSPQPVRESRHFDTLESITTAVTSERSSDFSSLLSALQDIYADLDQPEAVVPAARVRQIIGAVLASGLATNPDGVDCPVAKLIVEIVDAAKPVPPKLVELNRAAESLYEELGGLPRLIAKEKVKEVVSSLRNARAFDWLAKICDRLIATGHATNLVHRYYAQALVDNGHIRAGIHVLEELKRQPLPKEDMDEVLGQLGRAYKQIYVDHVQQPAHAGASGHRYAVYLKEAIRHYAQVYDENRAGETAWHGINVVALVMRAKIDGVQLQPDIDARAIAHQIIADLERKDAEQKAEAWDLASLGEAYLALGDYAKAAGYYERYASHKGQDFFKLAGTLRQLEQVWRSGAAEGDLRRCMFVVKAALAGQPISEFGLTATERKFIRSPKFETSYHDGEFLQYSKLKKIVRAGECVAWIKRHPHAVQGTGTGFLIVGSALAPVLGDELFLLTNTHVICDARIDSRYRDRNSLLPEEAYVQFEASDEMSEGAARPRSYRLHREAIWLSPSSEYDACLLRLTEQPERVSPARLARSTEHVSFGLEQDEMDGTPVAVLGHAGGRELQIGVRGTLHNHQGNVVDRGPRKRDEKYPIYVHYNAPTLGGNSGSPVYDMSTWEVIAIHHEGYDEYHGRPRLEARGGNHFANEGIDIRSIGEAVQRDLAGGGKASFGSWFRRSK